jgi:hypothetical protein
MSGVVVLLTAVLLASAAPVATARSSPTTIDFAVATASRDEHEARTAGASAGAFTMTGRFAGGRDRRHRPALCRPTRRWDRDVDRHARHLHDRPPGTFGAIVDNRQDVAGAWSVVAAPAPTRACTAAGTGTRSPTSAPRPPA